MFANFACPSRYGYQPKFIQKATSVSVVKWRGVELFVALLTFSVGMQLIQLTHVLVIVIVVALPGNVKRRKILF